MPFLVAYYKYTAQRTFPVFIQFCFSCRMFCPSLINLLAALYDVLWTFSRCSTYELGKRKYACFGYGLDSVILVKNNSYGTGLTPWRKVKSLKTGRIAYVFERLSPSLLVSG